MEFESVLRGRRSVRAYTAEPVARELIEEVLDEARWSPSWRNTQGWSIWVVTGGALERFKERFRKAVDDGESPSPDFVPAKEWPVACSARTTAMMQARAASLEAAGLASDPDAALARMADLFGAPCLLVFGMKECLASGYAAFDTGLIVQSVCLAAYDRGLGSCILATLVRHPDLLREFLPGGEDKRFVVAVTLGHPDHEAAMNRFERTRAALDELVTGVE